eukprot:1955620-Pyramimonas_sp.AAC.1
MRFWRAVSAANAADARAGSAWFKVALSSLERTTHSSGSTALTFGAAGPMSRIRRPTSCAACARSFRDHLFRERRRR